MIEREWRSREDFVTVSLEKNIQLQGKEGAGEAFLFTSSLEGFKGSLASEYEAMDIQSTGSQHILLFKATV